DRLHEAGSVYADALANAVFPRVSGGAFLRGTGPTPFKRTIGKASAGPMVLPGPGDAWLCEGPLDGVSIKSHHSDAHVIVTGGNLMSADQIKPFVPDGRQVHLAFDQDKEGLKRTNLALQTFPGAVIEPPPGEASDWGAAPLNTPEARESERSEPGAEADKPGLRAPGRRKLT
ncbi:MAG TPA: toprim domain-containing protein, partial [Acidiphilium sp.]|nr:toprim domain-containing protein [Acidiphilium sp.]